MIAGGIGRGLDEGIEGGMKGGKILYEKNNGREILAEFSFVKFWTGKTLWNKEQQGIKTS